MVVFAVVEDVWTSLSVTGDVVVTALVDVTVTVAGDAAVECLDVVSCPIVVVDSTGNVVVVVT